MTRARYLVTWTTLDGRKHEKIYAESHQAAARWGEVTHFLGGAVVAAAVTRRNPDEVVARYTLVDGMRYSGVGDDFFRAAAKSPTGKGTGETE